MLEVSLFQILSTFNFHFATVITVIPHIRCSSPHPLIALYKFKVANSWPFTSNLFVCLSLHSVQKSFPCSLFVSSATSVTRYQNKINPSWSKCSHSSSFCLKVLFFKNSPTSHRKFSILLYENLFSRSFKNRPIWSHCFRVSLSTPGRLAAPPAFQNNKKCPLSLTL